MRVSLINPNLVVQRSDPFTTGIIYMPIGLASVAASLRSAGVPCSVVDAFGEAPSAVRRCGAFNVFGCAANDVVARVPEDTTLAVVYAINLTNHVSTIEIVRALKHARPKMSVAVLENTQAVTAYSLRDVASQFYSAGADFIVTGEGEHRVGALATAVASGGATSGLDGIGSVTSYIPPSAPISDLDALPPPAWDLFPLKNYWSVGHAHGPVTSGRYLPLLTSRGCPYPCRFCVVPATNAQMWRARSAASVVDEMAAHVKQFGVTEFHIEDLNPTISDVRMRAICDEIMRRGLNVTWKLASGTKVESIKSEETVELMARAGCRYISISPETGSAALLKSIRKPFDQGHAERIVAAMARCGIRSQACFVLGFPGETPEDLAMTRAMALRLTRLGVDEIALFIVTPVPGSSIYNDLSGFQNLSELNFSPVWRADYAALKDFRLKLYREFLLTKAVHRPLAITRQAVNFLRRRFETKMEMAPFRALKATWLARHAR